MKKLASYIALASLTLAAPALLRADEGDSKKPAKTDAKGKGGKTKTDKKDDAKKDAAPAGGGW